MELGFGTFALFALGLIIAAVFGFVKGYETGFSESEFWQDFYKKVNEDEPVSSDSLTEKQGERIE